jgi:hypothetical protein
MKLPLCGSSLARAGSELPAPKAGAAAPAGSKNPSPDGAWPPPSPLGEGKSFYPSPWGEGGRRTRTDEGSFHELSRAKGPKG